MALNLLMIVFLSSFRSLREAPQVTVLQGVDIGTVASPQEAENLFGVTGYI